MAFRYCPRCETDPPEEDFYTSGGRVLSPCKVCKREQMRAYGASHPRKRSAEDRKRWNAARDRIKHRESSQRYYETHRVAEWRAA